MLRRKTVRLNESLRLFWKENPELYHKMLEARVQRLWGELFGPSIAAYTTNVFVKNRILYVSMTSSVVRSELLSMRKRLVITLNEHAGSDVIDDVMIR
jgi:predicted nucleic acid-binding Zn ribbon protein